MYGPEYESELLSGELPTKHAEPIEGFSLHFHILQGWLCSSALTLAAPSLISFFWRMGGRLAGVGMGKWQTKLYCFRTSKADWTSA